MYCTQINWWFLRAEVEFVVCKQVPHLSLAFSKAAITVETELNSVAAVSLSSRNCRFILRDDDEDADAESRKALDMWTAFMRKRRAPEECVRNPYLK